MPRIHWLRVVSMLALVAGLIGLLILLARGPEDLLSKANSIAGVGSGVLTAAGLYVTIATARADQARDEQDTLDKAVRWIAGQQRERLSTRLDRAQVFESRRLLLMGTSDAEPDVPRPLSDFIDRFVDELGTPKCVPRMIVLGPAGAGKTTMATLLVARLLEVSLADQDAPRVPVMFRLASWHLSAEGGPALAAWLTTQLAEEFGGLKTRFGPRIPGELVGSRRILAVLDGLDELSESVRSRALTMIDGWLERSRDKTPFVLTCRSAEYAELNPTGAVLPQATVVRLQPVEGAAALSYLASGDDPRWSAVWSRLAQEGPSGPLAQALSTPLMIYVASRIAVRSAAEPRAGLERLADRTEYGEREAIENMLLDEFVPAVLRDEEDHAGDATVTARWPAAKAQRWLTFLATRLAHTAEAEINWSRLSLLAPARSVLLPAVFGLVAGMIVAEGARLTGLPTGIWWGWAAGAGFATLMWLLGRPRPAPASSRPLFRSVEDGLRIGLLGGLAVGLPGALFASALGEWVGAVSLGLAFGTVAGLLTPDPRKRHVSGTGLVTGLVAGSLAWLVAALVCGFPEGAQLQWPDQLPGGSATGALHAWRASLSFGLGDQLRTALAFSLSVGAVTGLLAELARSRIGAWCVARCTRRDGTQMVALTAVVTATACGVAGAATGRLLAGPVVATGVTLVTAAIGAVFGPLAFRRRTTDSADRAHTVLSSLYLRVSVGLVGGLIAGVVAGFALPAPYTYLAAGRLVTAGAGAADGVQAGLAIGLITGLVFGLLPRTAEPMAARLRTVPVVGTALASSLRPWISPAQWAALGVVGGALLGVGLFVALGKFITRPFGVVFLTYLLVGLALGLSGALVAWVEDRPAWSFRSRLATARLAAFAASALVSGAAGAGTWLVSIPTYGAMAAIMALIMVVGTSPWGRYTAVRLRLAATRRLPWRLVCFLQDMYGQGILRQAGALYQFRHVRLRDRLALADGREHTSRPQRPARWQPWIRPASMTVAAAGLVALAIAGPLRATASESTAYREYRAEVAAATPLRWELWWWSIPDYNRWGLSETPPTFTRGYAVEQTVELSGPGLAGFNVPGIAYVMISCRGQYAFYPSPGSITDDTVFRLHPLQEGYSPAIHAGSNCVNRLAVLVQPRRVRLFINETLVAELPTRPPTGGVFVAPEDFGLSRGGLTFRNTYGERIWSLDPGPRT